MVNCFTFDNNLIMATVSPLIVQLNNGNCFTIDNNLIMVTVSLLITT